MLKDDEEARLAALSSYRLTQDTAQDDLFEGLVDLAQSIGGTAIAFIALIESERQWFKAARGLEVSETPREIAFCDHAIREAEVMVVLDAEQDPRFADNPLVTGAPHIRFYAGAPIINPQGYAVGTICIADPEPRERFDDAPQLAILAGQAAALIELRKGLMHQQLAADLAADQRDRLWDSSLDMMLIIRSDGAIVAGNPAWEEAFGPVPLDASARIRDYFADQDVDPVTMENGQKNVQVEREMRGLNGQTIFTSWNLAKEDDLIFGIARDITRARAAETQLAHAQRMESIGQLTGGIAHDFNNLLTIILGNLDMAQRRIDGGDTDRAGAAIQNARDGAQRAANLTQRLLAFARRQSLSPSRIEPDAMIRELTPLARQALDERYDLKIDSHDALWPLLIDVSQLENAILNLVVNARDAMSGNGAVEIQLTNKELDEADAARISADAKPGRYVRICVHDTGAGIPPDVVERIFEPFFTTKDVGRGTGLGLSQVQGFVAQSGGFVTLRTRLGAGTTLSLWLPALEELVAPPPAIDAQDPGQAPRRKATILLVEDSEALRTHIGALLREEGLDVVEAADGLAAQRLLVAEGVMPDLVLSDVMMPGMDGQQLAYMINERWPDLPIVLMTGYAGGVLQSGCPHKALINKPFSSERIIEAVLGNLRSARETA